MSRPPNSRITLELEAGADPIRGTIEHPDGSRQPFWGWLELIEELHHAADHPAARAGQRQPHTTTEEPS